MPIDRNRFITAFLVANVLLISVLAGLASTGLTVAVPLSGAGGFTVAFDELQGEGFEQYSTLQSREGCQRYPVSETQIENGTIEGLHLFTDLELPLTDDTIRVSIEAESVEFEGIDQRFTNLTGDIAFDGDQIVEYDSSEETMRVTSQNITIRNGSIQTERQYIAHLSLDELNVDVETNPDEAKRVTPEVNCQPMNGSERNRSASTRR